MNDSTFKQLVFDCAMELMYEQEGSSKEDIGKKLLNIIKLHDEKDSSYGMRVRPLEGNVTKHSNYNPEDIKPIAPTPKIKEIVIYADEVAVVYYTNGTCEHVGDVSYRDAILVVEGDEAY